MLSRNWWNICKSRRNEEKRSDDTTFVKRRRKDDDENQKNQISRDDQRDFCKKHRIIDVHCTKNVRNIDAWYACNRR
jgi:hypothetical protein